MASEPISRKTFAKGLTAGVVAAASLGLLAAGEYSINGLPTIGEGNGDYEPGTYTAAAAGISSDVTVTCTFNETTITSIEADVSGETPGLGADIGDEMVGKVLENQTAEVDGVSGCTITSDAFKTAVANCIAQASGEEIPAETEAETTAAAADDADVSEAAAPVEAGALTPGTYTASAPGISSDVVVTVEIDGSGIAAVTADVSGETAGIGADIGDEMCQKVLDAQSAQVDGVAGATITSDAFKAAVADCLAQAAGGGAADTEDETEAAETENTGAAEDAAADEGSLTPGTYTASAPGISSDVAVTVEIDESGIAAVTADVSGETAGIGAEIGDEMSQKVLDAQSAQVDGVAGATITSDAFRDAVADCLAQAAGGETEDAADETEAETAVSEDAADETEAETGDSEDAQAEDVQTEDTDTAESEDAGAAEAAAVGAETLTPGTYTASAPGISSDVVVTLTIDETGIAAVESDVSGETAGIGAEIGDDMESHVLEAQSADVDGIAGATITSDAFKTAVADCLAQAAAGSADAADAEMEEAAEEDVYLAKADPADSLAAPAGSFTPGTYTASVYGISSDVTVTIVCDETNILEVTADVSGETPGIGAEIDNDMQNQILAAQSAEVDGISGATITSDAIKEAASECIAQASGEAPVSAENETEAETN